MLYTNKKLHTNQEEKNHKCICTHQCSLKIYKATNR